MIRIPSTEGCSLLFSPCSRENPLLVHSTDMKEPTFYSSKSIAAYPRLAQACHLQDPHCRADTASVHIPQTYLDSCSVRILLQTRHVHTRTLRAQGRSDWIVLVTASYLSRVLELRSVQVANPLICAMLYMRQGQLIADFPPPRVRLHNAVSTECLP